MNRLPKYIDKKPKGKGIDLGFYILKGHEPVPEPDTLKWAMWLNTADRRVSKDIVIKSGEDAITVSTVFLGLNHQYNPEEPPLLFETMIFGGKFDQDMWRYSTWDEAVKGHNKVAEKIKKHVILTSKRFKDNADKRTN